MRNIKYISIFAASGFVLSFVFGLFSHSSFWIILLRAVIFGVIFAALGFLISIVFNKFLSDPNASDFGEQEFSDLAAKENGSPLPKTGQLVDVVVEDEDLTPSDSDNHFVVGDNHQMLKNTDIREENNITSGEPVTNREFVPIREAENVENFSGKEAVATTETVSSSPSPVQTQSVETSSFSDDNLDTLPDMESMAFSDDSSSGEDLGSSYSDTGFGSSSSTYKKSDGSGPDVKDAALIAKAISTALSEEN